MTVWIRLYCLLCFPFIDVYGCIRDELAKLVGILKDGFPKRKKWFTHIIDMNLFDVFFEKKAPCNRCSTSIDFHILPVKESVLGNDQFQKVRQHTLATRIS